uniref:Uncharacterized protein n=1 Tax=Rhizophora mucronata TaxID=61149 RepID=A0A2P2QLZ6_RHIMU
MFLFLASLTFVIFLKNSVFKTWFSLVGISIRILLISSNAFAYCYLFIFFQTPTLCLFIFQLGLCMQVLSSFLSF